MSFDEEHLDDHYECQREVAMRDALLRRVADVMRRCDPEYVRSHEALATDDQEWDDLLEAVEDAIPEPMEDVK